MNNIKIILEDNKHILETIKQILLLDLALQINNPFFSLSKTRGHHLMMVLLLLSLLEVIFLFSKKKKKE